MKRASQALLSLAIASLVSACNGFFYQPTQSLGSWPERRFEEVWLHTSDGATLHGWFFPTSEAPKGTVVQFHGNAGNVSWHYKALDWVVEHGYQFLTFDYRGYGRSSGYPHPEALRQDALAAIRYAQSLPESPRQPDLVLYGQSLGGAVLLDALGQGTDRRRVRLVVVEGTFHSYEEVAASVLWRRPLLFPLTGFAYATVSDAHAPERSIPLVSPTPLLVIHGDHDEIVPPSFGRAVYDLARAPRALWIVPGGPHIGAMRRDENKQRLLAAIDDPLASMAPSAPARAPLAP